MGPPTIHDQYCSTYAASSCSLGGKEDMETLQFGDLREGFLGFLMGKGNKEEVTQPCNIPSAIATLMGCSQIPTAVLCN